MREQAGLTLADAARLPDKTRGWLGRIETGESRADVHLVRSMTDFYDIHDPDLLDLVREANRPGWWTKYGIDDLGYVSAETEASMVREFSIVNIPGLLQTEAYVRALFATHRLAEHKIDNEVAARLYRQRRLDTGTSRGRGRGAGLQERRRGGSSRSAVRPGRPSPGEC